MYLKKWVLVVVGGISSRSGWLLELLTELKMDLYCPQGIGTLRQQLTILHILHILAILHIIYILHILHSLYSLLGLLGLHGLHILHGLV